MYAKILAAAFALLLTAGSASALPLPMFTYSGYLRDSTGSPVTAPSDLTFRLYAGETGVPFLYSDTISVVPNADGYFSAVVGGVAVLGPEAFQVPRYLTIEFGTEGEMAPRIPLTSVPSAFSALTVDWAGVVNAPVFVTSVAATANSGLAIGGTSAAPTIGLVACTMANQIMKWDGAAWGCAADVDTNSGGTVTSVTASLPLSSTGGATPNLTIAAASATVTGALRASDFVTFSGKANVPTCSNTTYAFTTAGTASANCPAGQIATGGGVYCSVGTSVTMTRPETNGWAAQCSAAGTHTLYVRCCAF
jgi:hypothetical protein